MQVTCSTCHARYDDAVCWTGCPYDQFISHEDAARKDLAHHLCGKPLYVFGDMPTRIACVAWDGMVEIDGFAGQFSPYLFRVVDA